jgi:hypothetical protein
MIIRTSMMISCGLVGTFLFVSERDLAVPEYACTHLACCKYSSDDLSQYPVQGIVPGLLPSWWAKAQDTGRPAAVGRIS